MYIKWFEDAYFLFSVRLFDASLSRSNANPKKIYCIDSALVTSIASGVLVNSGFLLENIVFIALRQRATKIFYYKTHDGREVDFLVQYADRSKALIQVCESLMNTDTRQRETQALLKAMIELKHTTAIIVTRNEADQLQFEDGKCIEVVPVWQYLLSAPS